MGKMLPAWERCYLHGKDVAYMGIERMIEFVKKLLLSKEYILRHKLHRKPTGSQNI